MFTYRKATNDDLIKIWDKDIADNLGDDRYLKWRDQYISYNIEGKAATFVVLNGDNPIGQITVLFSTECSAVKNRPVLCDGNTTANMNAFRIEKQY